MECLTSIERSTLQPTDIVLVVDGPVPDQLEDQIATYQERLPIRTRRLCSNVGLAKALNAGLEEVRTEWVARMDTDDICEPERFEEQLKYARDHKAVGLFGSDVIEFGDGCSRRYGSRRMPTDHAGIMQMLKWRNPFNHMTVMYRKSDVLGLGGYPDVYRKEDYVLWIRMAAAGVVMGNTGSVLVRARAGGELLKRRSGFRYLRSELDVHKELRRNRLTTKALGYDALALRCFAFSMPVSIKSSVYRRFLRTSA